MAFDFSKLGAVNTADTVLHPREIFTVLSDKDPRYQYPRDVQAEVWNKWFEQRDRTDTVIRMNTGSGKTIVGLLILKSCLNEGKGPAVYIVPDQYLATQVKQEAAELGIEVTDQNASMRFQRGKAILVTTIRTLINGKSTFGVGGINIPIGSLLIDDAHACLETTETQFTMNLDGKAHDEMLSLFREDLRLQSESLLLELEDHERGRYMAVPFWAWRDRQTAVIQALHAIQTHTPKPGKESDYSKQTLDSLLFNYPLIKDSLKYCRCVFGGGRVEISPRILPIAAIPSFCNAARRIVMSATLADDSVLITHFDINASAAGEAITPLMANDIGDRMILLPQELNPELDDNTLKTFYTKLAEKHNVIVIVPSQYRSTFWLDSAKLTLTADNLDEGVKLLQKQHVGLVVLINKYDGIDLPKSACDVLVIDGLPDVRRAIDKIEEGVLFGTEQVLMQRIQRIEQGMGRGVRSNDDHCLVFLMGKTLTNFLYKAEAKKMFSSATRAQLELSEKLTEDLQGVDLSAISELAGRFLDRDTGWVKASKGAMVHLKYESVKEKDIIARKQREAFTLASRNDCNGAKKAIEEAANSLSDNKLSGWMKHQIAEYVHFLDPIEAQLILRSAIGLNPRLTRPLEGLSYRRLQPMTGTQALACANLLKEKYETNNHLLVDTDSLLSQLEPNPDTTDAFEEALKKLGVFLGFDAQRPEDEFGRGPDVLWQVGPLNYIVIECKSGIISHNPINKHDCNQLNGSIVWFKAHYPQDCSAVPWMIHRTAEHEFASSLSHDTRIVTFDKLHELINAIRGFAVAGSQKNYGDPKLIGELLAHFRLTFQGLSSFTVEPQRKKSGL